MKRLLHIGLPSLAAAAAILALPAVNASSSSGCQPKNWADWHLALRQQCLEQRYVCEHMTSAEMMRDADIAAAHRDGLALERPELVRILAHVVGQTRARYGCDAAPAEAPPPGALPQGHSPVYGDWADELPPGHPPVDEHWTGVLPPGHPPVDGYGALPPGHPPVGTCPFAGPGTGRAPRPAGPLPFTFEAPRTVTL